MLNWATQFPQLNSNRFNHAIQSQIIQQFNHAIQSQIRSIKNKKKWNEPGIRCDAPDDGDSFGQNVTNRSLKSFERIRQILLPAEEEDHICGAEFSDAGAGGVLTTYPDANVYLTGRFERRQCFCDGGGGGDPLELRLPYAQVRHLCG